VLERRCPAIEIYILPVAVQGDTAAPEIAAAIERANRWQKGGKSDIDALIVGRGGGSLEDLWAFNEEIVARAIAASALPIVSAVGHEVDFSIADMVADHRAATPSAAAELLSPDQREWLERLRAMELTLERQIRRKLADAAKELEHLKRRLKHPGAQLREQSQRLDDLEQRLILAQRNLLRQRANELALLQSRLLAQSPLSRIQQGQQQLNGLQQRMEAAIRKRLEEAGTRLGHLAQMLDSLSPLATLQRGYAIVTDAGGKVISDSSEVAVGAHVRARLASGSLDLTVDSVIEAPPEETGDAKGS
jgi:exodeoxyribonuclease VII large subunit